MTIFGLIFIPLLFYIAIFKNSWLPGLVLASTAFQAASVLNLPVGQREFGISPYNITALLIAFIFLVRLTKENFALQKQKFCNLPYVLFFSYIIVTLPGAFFLPHLFEGLKVFLLFDPFPMDVPPVSLRWTLSNAVQAVNLCVHAVVLLYLAQSVTRKDWKSNNIISSISISLIIVLVANFWERVSFLFNLPSYNSFWASNPGYYISSLAKFDLVGIRVGTPFSEPSYASVFFASIGVGMLAVATLGKNWRVPLLVSIICLSALMNTFGATGWASAILSFVILLIWLTFKAFNKNNKTIRSRAIIAWFLVFLFSLVGAWFLFYSSRSIEIYTILNNLIISKLELNPNEVRHNSNLLALRIVQDTWGLGVGLGSNRASSYFASLISNTGVMGFVLFSSMLFSLLARYWRATHLNDIQIFAAASLCTATLAMGLGIPDLNLPMYWGFIFLAFLFYPDDDQMNNINSSKSANLSDNNKKGVLP